MRRDFIEWSVGLLVLAGIVACAAYLHLPPPHLNEQRSVYHGHKDALP